MGYFKNKEIIELKNKIAKKTNKALDEIDLEELRSIRSFRLQIWTIMASWALVIVTLILTTIGIIFQIKNLNDTNKVASANFVWDISKYLDSQKYDNISAAIDNNSSSYSLNESSIDDYIGNFETIGDLMRDGLVNPTMAYDELGYQAEKAWCNIGVQGYINKSRKADGILSGTKAFYSGFEYLATLSLSLDRKDCLGIDKEY